MKQKAAASIYLVIVILICVLMIALSVSSFMLIQRKMASETDFSTRAYQAADTGMERALLAKKEIEEEMPGTFGSASLGSKLWDEFGSELGGGSLPDYWTCSGDETVWFLVGGLGSSCSFCLDLNQTPEGAIYIISTGKCGQVMRSIQVTY